MPSNSGLKILVVIAVVTMLGMLGYIVIGHQNTLGAKPAVASGKRPTVVLTKTPTSKRQSSGGYLPLAPNYAYVPAYALTGKPIDLDVKLTSLLFFDPSNAASAADIPTVAKEVLAKGNRPRPLVLVAVVHTTSLKQAAAEVQAFMGKHKVSNIPVFLQQGPPLVDTFPTLVWWSGGKAHVHTGMPTAEDIANALAPAASA